MISIDIAIWYINIYMIYINIKMINNVYTSAFSCCFCFWTWLIIVILIGSQRSGSKLNDSQLLNEDYQGSSHWRFESSKMWRSQWQLLVIKPGWEIPRTKTLAVAGKIMDGDISSKPCWKFRTGIIVFQDFWWSASWYAENVMIIYRDDPYYSQKVDQTHCSEDRFRPLWNPSCKTAITGPALVDRWCSRCV